jgi:hypothetical protein
MRWAALSRRPPIRRGVSASHIRADHAINQARINAHYGPALPSSPQLRGEADAAYHSTERYRLAGRTLSIRRWPDYLGRNDEAFHQLQQPWMWGLQMPAN